MDRILDSAIIDLPGPLIVQRITHLLTYFKKTPQPLSLFDISSCNPPCGGWHFVNLAKEKKSLWEVLNLSASCAKWKCCPCHHSYAFSTHTAQEWLQHSFCICHRLLKRSQEKWRFAISFGSAEVERLLRLCDSTSSLCFLAKIELHDLAMCLFFCLIISHLKQHNVCLNYSLGPCLTSERKLQPLAVQNIKKLSSGINSNTQPRVISRFLPFPLYQKSVTIFWNICCFTFTPFSEYIPRRSKMKRVGPSQCKITIPYVNHRRLKWQYMHAHLLMQTLLYHQSLKSLRPGVVDCWVK